LLKSTSTAPDFVPVTIQGAAEAIGDQAKAAVRWISLNRTMLYYQACTQRGRNVEESRVYVDVIKGIGRKERQATKWTDYNECDWRG